MTSRFGPGAVVLSSQEDSEGRRCVDIFRRADGSFGAEAFRRDPEDGGLWTVTGHFSALTFATEAEARNFAKRAIAWFAED
jgi:hypothetical protein